MPDEQPKPSGPVYDNYEIMGCREYDDGAGRFVEPCDDAEARFWTLYGHIDGQGVEAIGDFASRAAAEEVYRRITGAAYGSHEQVADRLRLMHAAPRLLEALEPYAIAAKNLMEQANGEENEDVVDHFCNTLVHAYTEATPRPPGAAAVARQIERLLTIGYLDDWDDRTRMHPEFQGIELEYVPRSMAAWGDLDRSEQERMLHQFVDWDGFNWPSIDRVKENVLAGKPKDEWFAGLDPRLRAEVAPSGSIRDNVAPPPRLHLAADCEAGLMDELEAFADEFARRARTPEQKALAEAFGQFVAGSAHETLRYLTAAAIRPDPAPRPEGTQESFDRLMTEAAGASVPIDPDQGVEP